MKGKYVVIDLQDMECIKDENFNMRLFDTESEALKDCKECQLDTAWVLQLVSEFDYEKQ